MKSTDANVWQKIARRWRWLVVIALAGVLAYPSILCFLYVILPLFLNWINGTE